MNTPVSLSRADLLGLAHQTMDNEITALAKMKAMLDDSDFTAVVERLYQCEGRVVVSGIGKSAVIAQKIVATFNSTGTPSLYMHAADAIHGDLGMVTPKDTIIIISKSGESPEIKALVPLVRSFGNTLIALTGNVLSFLAREADYILNTTVDSEADPNNLAPTTSTTAQLVMGDTLAVCLLKLRGFTAQDFARYHPGGTLGKQLYLTVADICKKNTAPRVPETASFKDVIVEITGNRLGATAVLSNDTITGIITDGDIRRAIQSHNDFSGVTARDIMSTLPKTIHINALAVEALNKMRAGSISQLLVEDNGVYKGIIHLHDLVAEGII
ncbi:MAG: D-arabinose 5-phosphate isomerase [Bacteroidetes bacterium 47-18]|nr:MAG: D-arabinose 5-phosphate isomerase [Bacteroidetes bacterium 47-18]